MNGNVNSRSGQTIVWTSANYPSQIPVGSETNTFLYGPNRERWQQVNSSGPETTIRVGQLLEKVTTPSGVDWRQYVFAGDRPVAIYSRKGSVNSIRYLLLDNLGGIATITTGAGAIEVVESYASYGQRRSGTTWQQPVSAADANVIAADSARGFTFHTQFAGGKLIHMNGRVEVSVTGRFLSADPMSEFEGGPHTGDTYAYARNNPLRFIDPSGFAYTSLDEAGDTSLTIVVEGMRIDPLAMSALQFESLLRSMSDIFSDSAMREIQNSLKAILGNVKPMAKDQSQDPLCTDGPSHASGSVQGEMYSPRGGGAFAIGSQEGRAFGLLRGGAGEGEGFTVSGSGALPIEPPESAGSGIQLAVTFQGGLTLRLPVTNWGYSFGAQLGFGWDSNGGFTVIHDFEKGGAWPSKIGFEKFYSVGLTAAGYSGRATAITSKGECRSRF